MYRNCLKTVVLVRSVGGDVVVFGKSKPGMPQTVRNWEFGIYDFHGLSGCKAQRGSEMQNEWILAV